MRRNSKPSRQLKDQKGQVFVMFASMLVVFIALAALSVDIGHVFLVRNQLQNAADAAALNGAGYLYPATSSGQPNWSLASIKATAAITLNRADGLGLRNGTVTTGYWDLTGASADLAPTTSTPTNNEAPAVKVTISKSPGNNGGPVKLFLGPIFGISTVNLSASAVAVTGSPRTVEANTLFPVAMAQNVYDTYWDKANNKPMIDPKTGQPYVFQISAGSQGGWSTFTNQLNDTPSIINLITSGNPEPLSIGDNVWMAPGVKADVYNYVPSNKDVMVAVTAGSNPGSFQPVVAFAPIHIDYAVGGSGKYIQVHFINNFRFVQSDPGGPYYGAYTAARLAK